MSTHTLPVSCPFQDPGAQGLGLSLELGEQLSHCADGESEAGEEVGTAEEIAIEPRSRLLAACSPSTFPATCSATAPSQAPHLRLASNKVTTRGISKHLLRNCHLKAEKKW